MWDDWKTIRSGCGTSEEDNNHLGGLSDVFFCKGLNLFTSVICITFQMLFLTVGKQITTYFRYLISLSTSLVA